MASARRTGTNENISTYGNGTRDYTSLATWEADTDNDLVTATTSEVLECYADSSVFSDSLYMFGGITDTSYFRIVRAASGEGHSGTSATGVRFTSTIDTLSVGEDNAQLQDLCATTAGSSSTTNAPFWNDNHTNVHFIGCIAYDSTNGGAGAGAGFYADFYSGSSKTTYMIDCIAHGCEDIGFGGNTLSQNVYSYNCTAVGCVDGFKENTGTAWVLKNCLSASNSNADFTGTFGATSEANASSDATAPGGGPVINMTFTFVNAAGDDYHLAATDYGALQRGLDLSADAAFAFDDDIDGDTILVWSIGADAQASFISSRRRGVGESVSTYGNGTRDYTALSTWEAATDVDVVTNKITYVLECYADSAEYDDTVTMDSATGDASYHRIIRPAVGEGHGGLLNTGVIFNATDPVANGNFVFRVNDNFHSVQDITATFNDSSAGNLICFASAGSADDVSFVGCIADNPVNSGAGTAIGFTISTGSDRCKYVNCLAYNCDVGFANNGTTTDNRALNCTAVDCSDDGFAWGSGVTTGEAINCLSTGSGNEDFDNDVALQNESYNASGDITAAGTGSRASQTFTFRLSGSNYHLSSIDTGANGFGTDMSAYADFPYNDDIDGVTIVVWSIGFDSDPVSGGGFGGGGFMKRRRR